MPVDNQMPGSRVAERPPGIGISKAHHHAQYELEYPVPQTPAGVMTVTNYRTAVHRLQGRNPAYRCGAKPDSWGEASRMTVSSSRVIV